MRRGFLGRRVARAPRVLENAVADFRVQPVRGGGRRRLVLDPVRVARVSVGRGFLVERDADLDEAF